MPPGHCPFAPPVFWSAPLSGCGWFGSPLVPEVPWLWSLSAHETALEANGAAVPSAATRPSASRCLFTFRCTMPPIAEWVYAPEPDEWRLQSPDIQTRHLVRGSTIGEPSPARTHPVRARHNPVTGRGRSRHLLPERSRRPMISPCPSTWLRSVRTTRINAFPNHPPSGGVTTMSDNRRLCHRPNGVTVGSPDRAVGRVRG